MPEESTAPDTKTAEIAVLALLDSFSQLENGWNSYSAAVPTLMAIENAKLLVTIAYSDDTIPERVEPSAMGGVGITFSSGDREVVVEIYNNGTAHALFADNVTHEMDTRPVALEVNGYPELLNEVRKYFHVLQPARTAPRSNVS